MGNKTLTTSGSAEDNFLAHEASDMLLNGKPANSTQLYCPIGKVFEKYEVIAKVGEGS